MRHGILAALIAVAALIAPLAAAPQVLDAAIDELDDLSPYANVSSNGSNSSAWDPYAPEYFLLAEWLAEEGVQASEIQESVASWAEVPYDSVRVVISDPPAAEPPAAERLLSEAASGEAASGEAPASLVTVSVAILFQSEAEAEAQLAKSDTLKPHLEAGLPPSSLASTLQFKLFTLYSPPPPSPPPPPPPPPPLPSFPPADPPAAYEPLDDDAPGMDMEPGAFMGIAAAALVGTTLLALCLLYAARHPTPLECGVVSHARLGKVMLHWGLAASRFRVAQVSAVAICFAILAGLGVPRIEKDVGTASSWVPSGSRYEGQLRDWERLVDEGVTDRSSAHILISSDVQGENLLDDPLRWLDATLRTVKRAYVEATVTAVPEGEPATTLSWKDFCFSVNHPILTQLGGTGDNFKPCINPSVLDPFFEQTWEFNASDTAAVGREKADSLAKIAGVGASACLLSRAKGKGDAYCNQVHDPTTYPSMYELSRSRIIERLAMDHTAAGHWIAASSQPWGKLFGSYVGSNGAASGGRQLSYAKSFVYTLYQDIPKEVVKHRGSVKSLTPEQFRDANERWLLALEAVLEEIDADEVNFPGVSVVYYPSDAIDRMYNEVGDAQVETIVIGYVCMFVFVVLSQLSWKRYTNFVLLGALGFVAILFANAAAYGFIALVGYQFNHTMLQALPFLALGLGVDDLFMMLHAFKGTMRSHRGVRAEVAVGLTLMEAGSSITITSFSIAAVFFVACLIPISALQSLLVSAGSIVLFNWLSSMTILPALLSVWAGLFETAEMRPTTAAAAIESAASQAAAERSLRQRSKRAGVKAAGSESSLRTVTGEPWWSPAEVVARAYTAFSESLPAKLAFLLVGLGLLVGLAALIPKVEVGYKEADLAKKGSYLARGIRAMNEQVYSQHLEELVVFGTGVDYTRDQARVLQTYETLRQSDWSAYGSALGRSGAAANTWLSSMYESTGVAPHWNLYNDSVDPGWAFYDDFHLWRKPQVFLEPRYPPSTDYLSFGGLFAGLLYSVNSFPYSSPDGPDDYSSDNKIRLSWQRVELDMTKLQSTDDKIAMARDFKEITQGSGLNIYMYGSLYTQLEQFLNLDTYFWQAAGISMLAVFVVALLLGMSWCAAALIAFFALALCVEVYGSLYLFDISYQTLACTSMLMSIGISVEFVAHPVAAFEFAVGTRQERLAEAMRRTALPVLEGAISSFLGFAFLAASDFEFVTKYFFYIFLAIVLFGTINALVFLPALLSLLGGSKQADDLRASAADSARRSGAMAVHGVERKSNPDRLEAGVKAVNVKEVKVAERPAAKPVASASV